MLTPIPADRLTALRQQWQGTVPNPWGPRHHGPLTPILIPYQHGDGAVPIAISYYRWPDLLLILYVDTDLPTDLPLSERCATDPKPSVRALMPDLRDLLPEIWNDPPLPPDSLHQLTQESEYEGYPRLWEMLFDEGSTWNEITPPRQLIPDTEAEPPYTPDVNQFGLTPWQEEAPPLS